MTRRLIGFLVCAIITNFCPACVGVLKFIVIVTRALSRHGPV